MPHQHGGNLRELARRAGRNQDQILDFSASINPLGPPDGLRAALGAEHRPGGSTIPIPTAPNSSSVLARRHQVAAEQIVVGNGSTEIFYALARGLSVRAGRSSPCPRIRDYAAAVQAAGREVCFLKLEESEDFALDWQALEGQLRGDDLLLLGQPNNPTGRALDGDALCGLAGRHPATTFVVDEAFADFMRGLLVLGRADHRQRDRRPLADEVLRGPRTAVGLCRGLCGGGPADPRPNPALVGERPGAGGGDRFALPMKSTRGGALPWSASSGERLTEELMKLPGLYVYPSVTNFLLVRLDRTDMKAPELADRLLREGIAIRTFDEEQHLDARFFRVAVRTEDENSRLCEALAARPERATACTRSRRAWTRDSTPVANSGRGHSACDLCNRLVLGPHVPANAVTRRP